MATAGQHRTRNFTARLLVSAALAIGLVLVLSVLATPAAQAQQKFSVIYSFAPGLDGGVPLAGLAIDRSGNLYGTTSTGGANDAGTVFKLSYHSGRWVLSPLYEFGSHEGNPNAKVVFGPDRTLYGTTFGVSGSGSYGTVFNLRPPATVCKTVLCFWTETVLHTFTWSNGDGASPAASVIFDKAGNLYGTTVSGGSGSGCGDSCGTVYELTPSGGGGWTENIIHTFGLGSDGVQPYAELVFDSTGNLYGTTLAGGMNDGGTVFQLAPSGSGWTENILFSFTNEPGTGHSPQSGLIFDQSGNLYGATPMSGSGGGGTVFALASGTWTFATLYSFTGNGGGGPRAALAMDAAGNLYGTTAVDGLYGHGSVFKLTPSNGGWTETDLYDFTGGSDGSNPYSTPVFDANGNLYGTTISGGAYGGGVVFQITP